MKNNPQNKEDKFAMIRRWQESGISQKQFCVNENVSMNNFQYWLRKFRNQNKPDSEPGFIKLSSSSAQYHACNVEVEFSNGNRIRFFNPVEISNLKNLAR